MPCFFCPTKETRLFPYESFVKLIGLSMHLFLEILTTEKGFFFRGEPFDPLPMESVHHITMLSGFIFGSIIEILIYFGVPFPKRTEYACTMIALLIQAILMSSKHTDVLLEMHVHQLWSIIIFLTLIAGCLEAYDPDCFWYVYARIFFFITQGTWLMQTAFVVWPHTNNKKFIWGTDHMSNSWLEIVLMFHFLGVATVLLLQYLLVFYTFNVIYKFYRKYELDLEASTVDNIPNMKSKSKNNQIEYSILINEDEI